MDEQEYPGNELTNDQAKQLRDAAVAYLLRGLELTEDKDSPGFTVDSMELTLKILDFVTG